MQVIDSNTRHDSCAKSRSAALNALPRRTFSISSHVIPGLIVTLDSVVILASAIIAYVVVVGDFIEDASYYLAAICFVWLATLMFMNFAGLYLFEPIMRPLAITDKIIISFGTTFLFLLAAAFSLKISQEYSRTWVASFAISACTATLIFRLLASRILGRLARMRVFSRNVVVVGMGEQTRKLLAHIEKTNPRFVSVLGLFAESSQGLENARYPILGDIKDLDSFIRDYQVDDVIISMPWSDDDGIMAMVVKLREFAVNVYLGSDLIGFRLPFRPPPDHFGEIQIVEVMGRPLAGWGIVRKAAIDYLLGPVLTVVAVPIMMLIAVAIKLESKGPVLFRQERYGFSNKVFHIYKFRTMRHSAAPEGVTIQATRNDPRVTRVGRFLRRTSLDELPQLFNVLSGTMSLVGPRPHAVDHNEAYAKMIRSYFARHRVKPGITGWAQVNGFRGEIKSIDDMEFRVQYDIHYAENWTLLFDLKVLAMTFFICLTGRNAY